MIAEKICRELVELKKDCRVLVVEDNELDSLMLRRLIERNGCVVECTNGKESALLLLDASLASCRPYRIMFLDMNLGGRNDGLEVLAEARRQSRLLPVCLVSGTIDDQTLTEAQQHGPLTVIRKPATDQHVRQVLAQYGVVT